MQNPDGIARISHLLWQRETHNVNWNRIRKTSLPNLKLPVLSELQRIVSFSLVPGPCLIHTDIMKGSFRLTVTTPSGIFTAWVPLNSKTWSLSWPLSVGSPMVQLAALLGGGRSSAVPEAAPTIRTVQWKKAETQKITVSFKPDCLSEH